MSAASPFPDVRSGGGARTSPSALADSLSTAPTESGMVPMDSPVVLAHGYLLDLVESAAQSCDDPGSVECVVPSPAVVSLAFSTCCPLEVPVVYVVPFSLMYLESMVRPVGEPHAGYAYAAPDNHQGVPRHRSVPRTRHRSSLSYPLDWEASVSLVEPLDTRSSNVRVPRIPHMERSSSGC